jgi:AAA family ATP:ADP antiporter
LAVIASALSLLAVSRLSRGYVRTLQKSLLQRAEALDLTRSTENLSRSTLLQTFAAFDRRELLAQIDRKELLARANQNAPLGNPSTPPAAGDPSDRISAQVLALRSGNIEAVRAVLSDDPVDPSLAVHLIPLLAWDDVSDEVIRALRVMAPRILDALIEALLDPSREFAVRRRVPRVIAVAGSARAVEGLRGGLADKRFEVRFQCGRALAIIHRRHPEVPVDRSAILAAVLRELEVDRPIWESRRLLDQRFEEADDSDTSVADRLLRERSNSSLEHVFTLLSLVLPAQPLRVAFRGLHTGDPTLRGTALEYLESVLPPEVREKLWPFLEIDRMRNAPSRRSSQEVLDQLMRSHDSISLDLKRLDRNGGDRPR